jgi:hypothetical protein
MFRNHKKFSLFVKVLKLFLKCPILVFAYKQKLWCGLTRWLACEWYLVLLSTRLVGIVRWGKTTNLCWVVRPVVFIRLRQLCCPSAAALFGQLLPQQGQFTFECCPLSKRSTLGSTSCPALGGWPVTPFSLSAFLLFLISAECWQLLWEVGLSSCTCSQPLLLYVCITESLALRVWLLASPPFSRAGSAFHPHLHCWC